MNNSPFTLHEILLKNNPPALTFEKNKDRDLYEWREEVRKAFAEVIRKPEKTLSSPAIIEYEKEHEDYHEIRFQFESEPSYFVPGHYLYPKNLTHKVPVIICLQGHSPGMHISLGRFRSEEEEKDDQGDRNFALQAVERGFAALIIEQRNFGECSGPENFRRGGCHIPAMQAILLGRTTIGERALDVSRAIDIAADMPFADTDRIGIMGNSGGGTATYYASCTEDRIKALMPSCAFCTVEDSIFSISHCQCNFMPGMLKYFEMADLAVLLAPRPLVVVYGKKDNIFPEHGVLKAYEVAKEIYKKFGAEDKIRLVPGDEGHRFYEYPSWDVFREVTGW